MISSSPDFAVRLVNRGNSTGSKQYLGRVEVYVGGQWGTICSLGWSIEDALVVCRMLGFSSASRAVTNGVYGLGTGVACESKGTWEDGCVRMGCMGCYV